MFSLNIQPNASRPTDYIAASIAATNQHQERILDLRRDPITRTTNKPAEQSPLTRLILFVNHVSRVAREQHETIFRTLLNNMDELSPQQQGTVTTTIRTALQPAYANLTSMFTVFRTPEFETQLKRELTSFVVEARRREARERNNNTVQRTDRSGDALA